MFIYTPERGECVGLAHGTQVVVRQGCVVAVEEGEDAAIPRDGYAVVLHREDGEVWGGQVVTGYAAQGFTEDKIPSLRERRSAIGFDAEGKILLAVGGARTVRGLTVAMRQQGAREARNLDGGVSSGL